MLNPPRFALDGQVVSRPTVLTDQRPASRIASQLAWLLVLLVVLTTPGLLSVVFVWLILVLLLGWFLSRIGMGWLLFSLARGRRRTAPERTDHTLNFRVDDGSQVRDVTIAGHRNGVALGDHVTVHAVRLGGIVRALTITNHTTGARLTRTGLIRALLVGALLVTVVVTLFGAVSNGGAS